MPQTKRVPKIVWYDVPAGTKPSECRGSTCGASFYWIRDEQGSAKPIDCSVEGGITPSEEKADLGQLDVFGKTVDIHDGRGVLHHSVCPDVAEFSGGAHRR